MRVWIGLIMALVPALAGAQEVSFRNAVQPILAKFGCSSGACHGAAAGKNGFKLSLRGYDDDGDWRAITRHSLGRRINPADPAHSLLLLKPTAALPHKGGERIKVGSPEYLILVNWIASGAPGPNANDPRIERIELLPAQSTLTPPQGGGAALPGGDQHIGQKPDATVDASGGSPMPPTSGQQ